MANADFRKKINFGTTNTCSRCHANGSLNKASSRITLPGQSPLTGFFCLTCHGMFRPLEVINVISEPSCGGTP